MHNMGSVSIKYRNIIIVVTVIVLVVVMIFAFLIV